MAVKGIRDRSGGLDGLLDERDTGGPGCALRFVVTINRVEPQRVKAARGSATLFRFENSGRSCRVVVLVRRPAVGDLKVQQGQDAHRGDGFESTGRLTTGLLNEGHVGSVKAVPGGVRMAGEFLAPFRRYLYSSLRGHPPRLGENTSESKRPSVISKN